MGPVALSTVLHQPGHETENSPPISAPANNVYSLTLLLHMTSLNAKGKVYFNFTMVFNFPDYSSPPLLLTISSSL
jgi:hypothetical protein